jgi:uncharacterized cupredoxin-like copper-binding protein
MHSGKLRRWIGVLAGGALLLALAGAAGCGDDDGEDRPNVDVIDGGDSGSASGSGTATGSGSGTVPGSGSGTGVAAEPGVVEPKPDDATQFNVALGEWYLTPDASRVDAGKIYFLVDNQGPEDPHEFVVIKSDEPADLLPVVDGKVPEDQVELLNEIEPFAPSSQASMVLELEPGNYVLICNIAEQEEGVLESHYGEGMYSALTVE